MGGYMGKSEISSKMNSMSAEQYTLAMGGNAQNFSDRDTGINQSNTVVYRYFNLLRDYAVNRFTWQSNIIDPYDLQMIEWLFFMTGKACLIYPIFFSKNHPQKGIKIKVPSIFDTNITLQNRRTGSVLRVNVIDSYVNPLFMPLKKDYTYVDFAMLSSNYTLFPENNVPLYHIAWEYANKLYEIDLAFNANSTKQRLPLLFNNGISENRLENNGQTYNMSNFTASNLVREAVNRNEQFVEIPQSQVGEKGLLFQTNQYSENNLSEYIECQRRVMDEYLELLGVEGKQEKHGVYESKDVQLRSQGNNNYKSLIMLRNRRFHADNANKKFGLDLKVEELQYQL